jgi:Protein of unknown function (DUF4230)
VSDLSPMTPETPRDRTLVLIVGALVLGALLATGMFLLLKREEPAELHAKPSNTLLVATRDLARLQTSELHVEKVIDLTDTQSRLYGLVEGTDNVLLVAVGDVTIGVDLGQLGDGDVTTDEKTHAAHMKLPAPELFSARLDEKGTYVYSRQTSVFAKRNEQLESKARQEAQDTIKRQADTPEAKDRAKKQAEKVLRGLATSFGATSVTFEWK